jgi:ankyrin repeat protein
MISLRAIPFASLLLAGPLLAGEIHDAAARGDVPRLTALAKSGPAVRASVDENGLTALHHAVIHRQPEAVAALIAAGAPLEARDREGQTPLHHLAHSVEESVVENFRQTTGGKFGDALSMLTQRGQPVTPAALLGLLRADLAEVDEPVKLLRNFAAASTAEQMDAELKITRALIAAGADVNALDKERSTPLHHAAMSPRPDLARVLLEAGAKVDLKNSTGLTPLHNAALFASPETAKLLLDHRADPEGHAALTSVPPLFMAVTRGDPAMINLLLDHRADVNTLGPEGETALARAALLGATEAARTLLDRGAKVGARFARVNRTPLHAAAARGFLPLVNLLLEHGVDPEVKDGAGFTPLHDAAEQGRAMTVRALLNAGAKVNTTNSIGRSALWLAAARGQTETVAYLLGHGADPALTPPDSMTAVHIAAFNARPGALRLLLAEHPPLTGLSRYGPPLHTAASGPLLRAFFATQAKPGQKPAGAGSVAESASCVKLLLEGGAALETVDGHGLSALQSAAAFGNKEALQILAAKQKGALTARDPQGLTALHHAARGPIIPGYAPDAQPALSTELLAGCGEAITFLLANGVTTHLRDNAGLTPLHHAASAGNLPALKTLLAAKADTRAADKSGGTPLHWAAARGRTEAAAALLAAKAAPNATDAEGQTPLHMAVAAGHTETAKLLLDKGADPNVVNRRGQNALSYAEAYNRPEIARLLRDRGAKTLAPPPQ